MSKNDCVIYEIDPAKPEPLTPEMRAQLTALAAMPDGTIDTSDLPPLTDGFFARAVRNPYCRSSKPQSMLRVDADILAWFKAGGRGYETRINAILRDVMRREDGSRE